jgi:hypothetical protein
MSDYFTNLYSRSIDIPGETPKISPLLPSLFEPFNGNFNNFKTEDFNNFSMDGLQEDKTTNVPINAHVHPGSTSILQKHHSVHSNEPDMLMESGVQSKNNVSIIPDSNIGHIWNDKSEKKPVIRQVSQVYTTDQEEPHITKTEAVLPETITKNQSLGTERNREQLSTLQSYIENDLSVPAIPFVKDIGKDESPEKNGSLQNQFVKPGETNNVQSQPVRPEKDIYRHDLHDEMTNKPQELKYHHEEHVSDIRKEQPALLRYIRDINSIVRNPDSEDNGTKNISEKNDTIQNQIINPDEKMLRHEKNKNVKTDIQTYLKNENKPQDTQERLSIDQKRKNVNQDIANRTFPITQPTKTNGLPALFENKNNSLNSEITFTENEPAQKHSSQEPNNPISIPAYSQSIREIISSLQNSKKKNDTDIVKELAVRLADSNTAIERKIREADNGSLGEIIKPVLSYAIPDSQSKQSAFHSENTKGSEPTIQVTIGCIDVHAGSSPVQSRPKSKSAAPMSLEEYFKKRNGGA